MAKNQAARRKTSVDKVALRCVLSHFATGITIVTARNKEHRPRAITVNAFTSLSLDPPLILYCLDKSAFHFDVFSGAKAFAVNILSAGQQSLSDRFAREADDDFTDLGTRELTTGSPILVGCLAALDCETDALHDAGDHLIVIGRVTGIDSPGAAEPLLYFRGNYRGIRP